MAPRYICSPIATSPACQGRGVVGVAAAGPVLFSSVPVCDCLIPGIQHGARIAGLALYVGADVRTARPGAGVWAGGTGSHGVVATAPESYSIARPLTPGPFTFRNVSGLCRVVNRATVRGEDSLEFWKPKGGALESLIHNLISAGGAGTQTKTHPLR